jgi:hypothetical protein
LQRPQGLVLENYDLRCADEMPVNRHIKSIVKCSDLLDITSNPHEFQVKGAASDTRGRAVVNVAIQPLVCHQELVINHYVTRSRQDWMAKIHRGSAVLEQDQPKYQAELFDHFVEICSLRDATIKRFVPAVRALLAGAAQTPGTSCTAARTDLFGDCSILVHIQNVGDVDGRIGDWIGMRGSGRWIEGFSITPRHGILPADVEYQAIVASDLVSAWIPGGTVCGTRGLGLPLRGFSVRLLGIAAATFECFYSATFLDGSVSGMIPSGQPCVAAGLPPLEALQIVLRHRVA